MNFSPGDTLFAFAGVTVENALTSVLTLLHASWQESDKEALA